MKYKYSIRLLLATVATLVAGLFGSQTVGAANDIYVGNTKLSGVTLVSFSYDGDLRLVTNGATITTSNTSCGAGLELYNGVCVPVCETGQERVNGSCVPVCEVGQERVNGSCVAVCEAGQERVNGSCVPVCETGQVRDSNGQCVTSTNPNTCPPGTPSGITCGFGIPDSDWASSAPIQGELRIPAGGGIIASSFKTTTSNGRYGTFGFQLPTNYRVDATNVWVSATPGGSVVGGQSRCKQDSVSKIYSLNWSQFSYATRCSLNTNTTYYLNMQHVSSSVPETRVIRSIQKADK